MISTRTLRRRCLQDKALMRMWVQEARAKWVRPANGLVKVNALQQSSKDWVHEFKVERVKPVKKASGTGDFFISSAHNCKRLSTM